MITKLSSAALRGLEAVEVEVEVNSPGTGVPRMVIVGLPDAAVRESAERVSSAVDASALSKGDGAITINLAPADLRKEGPSFDLPIALGWWHVRRRLSLGELLTARFTENSRWMARCDRLREYFPRRLRQRREEKDVYWCRSRMRRRPQWCQGLRFSESGVCGRPGTS